MENYNVCIYSVFIFKVKFVHKVPKEFSHAIEDKTQIFPKNVRSIVPPKVNYSAPVIVAPVLIQHQSPLKEINTNISSNGKDMEKNQSSKLPAPILHAINSRRLSYQLVVNVLSLLINK